MNDQTLRRNLEELLIGGQAHLGVEKAIKGLQPQHRSLRPHKKRSRSIYEELEHMRLAQEDILRYTLDAGWKSPPWPKGYWPLNNDQLNEEIWIKTVALFFKDLNEVKQLARNPEILLTEQIPHGEGRTYLRQILLIADHNAYHLGKIMQTRKILDAL